MAATISSTFDIVIDETIAAAANVTVANPGRAYNIVSMFVTGSNNAVATLTRVGTAGTVAVSTLATGDLNDFPAVVTVANTAVDDENLLLSAATAGITRAVIVCEAAVPEPLTVTLT